MKKISSLILLIIANLLSFAQWEKTNLSVNASIKALAVIGTNLFAGTDGDGIFLSQNNGSTWIPINNGLTYTNITSLTVSGSILFAGTNGGGVFITIDTGNTWHSSNYGLGSKYISSLVSNETSLLAGTYDGEVLISTNRGSNWTLFHNGLPKTNIRSIITNDTNIFLGTDNGIYLSSSSLNKEWKRFYNFRISNTSSLAIINGYIYSGTDGYGIYVKSLVGEEDWKSVNTGLPMFTILSLFVCNDILFTSTYYGEVSILQNKSKVWMNFQTGLPKNTKIYSFAKNGSIIFAGTDDGSVWKRDLKEISEANEAIFAQNGSVKDCDNFILKYPKSCFLPEVNNSKMEKQKELSNLNLIKKNSNKALWKLGNKICLQLPSGLVCGSLNQWNEDKSMAQIKIISSPGGIYEGEPLTQGNLIWISTSGKGWHICIEDEMIKSNENNLTISNTNTNNNSENKTSLGKNCYWYEEMSIDNSDGSLLGSIFSGITAIKYNVRYSGVIEQELGDNYKIIIVNACVELPAYASINQVKYKNSANEYVQKNIGKNRVLLKTSVNF